MGNFTEKENKNLIALVNDCVSYRFTEKEALLYIKERFGKEISVETYYRRKKIIDSGEYAREWLNYFSRVGFAVTHKKLIDCIEVILQDTFKDYYIEQKKPPESRNMELIHRLRKDIRENSELLQELSMGSPIIAKIKARLENVHVHPEA